MRPVVRTRRDHPTQRFPLRAARLPCAIRACRSAGLTDHRAPDVGTCAAEYSGGWHRPPFGLPEQLADDFHEMDRLAGFLKKDRQSVPDVCSGVFRPAGCQYDRQSWPMLSAPTCEGIAVVEAWHVDVRKYEIDFRVGPQEHERFCHIPGFQYAKTRATQVLGGRPARVNVILDEEDCRLFCAAQLPQGQNRRIHHTGPVYPRQDFFCKFRRRSSRR